MSKNKTTNTKKICPTCKGSGRQYFHGAFSSYADTCNFCGGSGKYEDYAKWFDYSFTARGLKK
jgi:DnaJ-class molecular chaperone